MADDLTMLEKIYTKFKELKEEAKTDCSINKEDLSKSFNVTQNLIKWITKKTEWTRVHRDFEEKRKKTYRKLYEFYDVEHPKKLSTKTEYELFIETDPQYTDCFNNSVVTKEIIQFIESTIETLKNKQWEIKHYLSYQEFINGR